MPDVYKRQELMGEEAFEKSGMQTDTTHISITDSELEQELGVIYDPVCIAVPYSCLLYTSRCV